MTRQIPDAITNIDIVENNIDEDSKLVAVSIGLLWRKNTIQLRKYNDELTKAWTKAYKEKII